jgi:tetratricopeptide (TPR) repeat protein
LAQAQYRQKKYDAATTTLQGALTTDGPHLAEAHRLMATLLYRKGDSAGALNELDAAIKLTPDAAPLHYQKGQIYESTGNTDGAQKAYEKAIQLTPDYTDALLALRRLETKKGP